MMDKLQIRTAVLSISSPGVHFGDDLKAKQLARRVNEEGTRGARLITDAKFPQNCSGRAVAGDLFHYRTNDPSGAPFFRLPSGLRKSGAARMYRLR
jgi:hypothetical protein